MQKRAKLESDINKIKKIHSNKSVSFNAPFHNYVLPIYCIPEYQDFSPAKIGFWPNSVNLKGTIVLMVLKPIKLRSLFYA